jgi:hypothetical protein
MAAPSPRRAGPPGKSPPGPAIRNDKSWDNMGYFGRQWNEPATPALVKTGEAGPP